MVGTEYSFGICASVIATIIAALTLRLDFFAANFQSTLSFWFVLGFDEYYDITSSGWKGKEDDIPTKDLEDAMWAAIMSPKLT